MCSMFDWIMNAFSNRFTLLCAMTVIRKLVQLGLLQLSDLKFGSEMYLP